MFVCLFIYLLVSEAMNIVARLVKGSYVQEHVYVLILVQTALSGIVQDLQGLWREAMGKLLVISSCTMRACSTK